MDPAVTTLHPADLPVPAQRWSLRGAVVPAVSAMVLLGVCAAIGLAGTPAVSGSPATIALLFALYVASRQARFEIGGVKTTATQAVVVPMWFAVEPSLLPVVVLVAEAVSRVIAVARAGDLGVRGPAIPRGAVSTAWRAVGPAAVLALLPVTDPSFADAPIVLAALVAQFAADLIVRVAAPVSVSPTRRALASSRALQLRSRWLLDLALAPVGVLAAAAMGEAPLMVLCLLPVAILLGQFAKERDERMLRAAELAHAYRGTAQLMGDVLEADDAYTGGEHTEGVVELSLAVGRHLGLDDEEMRNLEFGALLHDVGKLRVPNEIINKPGKLNHDEWAIIKQHPRYGQEMLDRVGGALSEAAPIVRAHHERWDGAGYPDGLIGEAIPIEARIITACDSFSAMTTNRSYRRAMTYLEAVEELENCSGTQFDPQVVEALRMVVAEGAPAEAGSPLSRVLDSAAAQPTASAASSSPAPAAPGTNEEQAA